MRIQVDRTLCSGHAQCHATAPELFDLDDIGYVVVPREEVPEGLEEAARRGVAACPERALRLVD